MSLAPGARLGPYEVTAKLGAGGMGEIWRARDTRLGREVAIKLLPDRLLGRGASLARFEREARAASSLNHPNIVTVHDVGTTETGPYLVMELVEGRTLRQMLARRRPMSVERVVDIAVQVAEAMAAAHAAGIVHRDLKPENLIVGSDGRVKILDFGLAKLSAAPSAAELDVGADDSTVDPAQVGAFAALNLSEPGTLLGTLGYMAPEQVRGSAVDFRADQFSFGTILYEVLTGGHPFERPTRIATLAAILDEEPEPLAERACEAPPPLRWIVERCLAKRPADRYASTLDLAHELHTLRDHLDEASAAGSASSGARRSPFGAAARRPWRRVAWLAAVAVAIAAGAWWLQGRAPALPAEKRLAVLGFHGAGTAPIDPAFRDGLVETLSSRLTQLERFQGSFWVVPASEVRKADVDSVEAAREALGATLAITGSVQKLGEGLRLTANLVDARTLHQLRALSFDSRRDDAAALQDDLVRRVGEMLDLEIGAEATRVLDAGRTGSAEAYDDYLHGRGHLIDFQNADSLGGAISAFQQAIQRDPRFALAYAALGEAYWRSYELGHDPALVDLARRACRRALELNDLLAPVHVTLGLLDRGTGEPERAAEDFRTALRLDPADVVARRELGSTLARLGRETEAESTLREALAQRPGDWASHHALGLFYYRQGRYPEATEQFRKEVEIVPANPRGWSNLGAIYQMRGLDDEARDALERAAAIRPTSVSLSNLATFEFYRGEYARAALIFDRALKLGDRDYRVWKNLAAAYYWSPGERERSFPYYRGAVERAEAQLEVNPRDAEVLADLAECLATLGSPEEALARLARALEFAPDDPEVLARAAVVHETLNQRAKALAYVDRALRAGYSRDEVARIPDFAELRTDPRFREIWSATAPPADP